MGVPKKQFLVVDTDGMKVHWGTFHRLMQKLFRFMILYGLALETSKNIALN